MIKLALRCLVVCAYLSISPLTLRSQVSDARLEGTIADESGSVIPGAAVTVSNVETGFHRSATTDGRGRFVFSNLPPAPYDLEASMTGFKTTIRQGITLTIGSQIAIDLVL